jgi:hypothetical protein
MMQAITLEKIENKGNQMGQTKIFFFLVQTDLTSKTFLLVLYPFLSLFKIW